jgi:hypothetical protein
MEIINEHFTKGGTAVTNFDAKDREIYEAAIAEYGDPDLVISERPMPDERGKEITHNKMHSLHNLRSDGRKELGEFWKIWRRIRDEKAVSNQFAAALNR